MGIRDNIRQGRAMVSIMSSFLKLDNANEGKRKEAFVELAANVAANTKSVHIDRFAELLEAIAKYPEAASALERFIEPFFEQAKE
jgi:hypothetical protein